MSVLAQLVNPRAEGASLETPPNWLVDALTGGSKSHAGVRVSPETALRLSTYYACIRNISEDIGKLPFIVYRRKGEDGRERQSNHPVHRLLNRRPNREMSAMSLRETLTGHALGTGNGFAWIQRTTEGEPTALWPIHPSRVEIKRSTEEILYYLVGDETGKKEPVLAEDMLHVHGLASDGVSGYSVAQIAKESIGAGLAKQQFGAMFFGRGGRGGGVLEHDGNPGDEERQALKEAFKRQHENLEDAMRVILLTAGVKYKAMTISMEDAQFIEGQEFSVEDICRWFREAPHKVQHLKRATFNNIEHIGLEHVTDTLQPWFVRWEQEVDEKLLPDEALYAEHLAEGLLRGDQVARSQFYEKLFQLGAISSNQIAARENLEPHDDGDIYYVSQNLKRADGSDEPPDPVPGDQPQQQQPAQPKPPRAMESLDRFMLVAVEKEVNKELNWLSRGKSNADTVAEFYKEQADHLADAMSDMADAVLESIGATIHAKACRSSLSVLADSICTDAIATIAESDRAELCGKWKIHRAAEIAARAAETVRSVCDEA